jgi:GAF domain-containing protein
MRQLIHKIRSLGRWKFRLTTIHIKPIVGSKFLPGSMLFPFPGVEKEKNINLSIEDLATVVDQIKDEIPYWDIKCLINQVETILDIDPSLPENEILQILSKNVREYLGAEFASIWLYDPEWEEMVSFGSRPSLFKDHKEAIPFEDAIAAEVVKTHQSYLVSNIFKEEKCKNKEKAAEFGICSMLSVPVSLLRYSTKDVDTQGVLQMSYKEEDKVFTPLEVMIAEMLSRQIGYAIAVRRIIYLHKLNVTKDKILEHALLKLARREGVKMKDMFNALVPELVDIIKIQRCSLFSVVEDRKHVILEAGYPEAEHGIGQVSSVKEPYINLIVNQTSPFGEFENEKIYPTYILIHNPKESCLLSPHLKRFLESHHINSVLYVPLRVDDTAKYFLAFDAQAHHRRFTDEEIKIFIFFGKELMKGLRLEKVDDILHDFRNPAIAAAGFVKRVQKILKHGDYASNKEKVDQALDIILEETSRIQELALTLYGEGKEGIVDLTAELERRFLLNEEAMKELKRENIHLVKGELESPLWIRCFPLHIERVLDNLLNNASNAVPEEGGELSIRSYRKDCWAVAEITNSSRNSEEKIEQCLIGEVKGRGMYITTRLVTHMGGRLEVESREGQTTFHMLLPLIEA